MLTHVQAFVGTMIKNQPLFIKGIDASNQELTKQNAFGAMGMFIFLFTSSAVYICFYKNRRDDEHRIRAQGYTSPGRGMHRFGSRDYHTVELPPSPHNSTLEMNESDGEEDEDDEMSHILS